MSETLTFDTPLGYVSVTADVEAITGVTWKPCGLIERSQSGLSPVLNAAQTQLHEYFAGDRRDFDLPVRVKGSDFQREVCDAMSSIPFGETLTYGDIAKALGAPAQAVGQACGGNPIPIIIPCHRVLGASGLGGFSGDGGVESKVWLLKLEGAASLLI